MHEKCDEKIIIPNYKAVYVKLTRSSFYDPRDCNITIEVNAPKQRLQIKFVDLDIDHEEFRQCGFVDKLDVYSVYGSNERLVGETKRCTAQ